MEFVLFFTPLIGSVCAMVALNWLVGGVATTPVSESDLVSYTTHDPDRSWLFVCDTDGRAGLALDVTDGHGIAVTQLGAHKVDHAIVAAALRIRIDRNGWRICLSGQPRTRVFKPWSREAVL